MFGASVVSISCLFHATFGSGSRLVFAQSPRLSPWALSHRFTRLLSFRCPPNTLLISRFRGERERTPTFSIPRITAFSFLEGSINVRRFKGNGSSGSLLENVGIPHSKMELGLAVIALAYSAITFSRKKMWNGDANLRNNIFPGVTARTDRPLQNSPNCSAKQMLWLRHREKSDDGNECIFL